MNQNIKETLKNLSEFPIVEDFRRELGGECDYRHLPIAPSMIKPDETKVILNSETSFDYEQLVDFSNSDLSSIEYPFVVLGNWRTIDEERVITLEKFVFCHDMDTTLTSGKISLDHQKLLDVMENDHYDVMAWGRVHGVLSEKQRKNSDIHKLSSSYKKKYNIREEEFNIPLVELDEYTAISYATSMIDQNKDVYQMTIMPNGEISLLGVENNKYHKFENIDAFTGEDLKPIPVDEFDSKFLSGKGMNKK